MRLLAFLLLATTSLSVLGFDHDRAGEPAIVLWNAVPLEAFAHRSEPGMTEAQSMRIKALQRWENEGGEIPVP